MGFEFSAEELSIRKLFKNYTSFEIPAFQRDYSWEALYYEKFLEDIINSISREEQDNYFIGTMVFSNPNKESKVDVVDGQQRLTTMTILFSALSERLRSINENTLAKALFRYVSDANDDGEDVPRLISMSSSPFLDSYIQTPNSAKKRFPTPTSKEDELLKKAYENIYNLLSEENLNKYDSIKNLTFLKKLIAIRDQVLGSKIISIMTKNKRTAYKVFEILNAKGMDLSNLDLIKNYIFERINEDPTTVSPNQKIAFKYWEDIKKILRSRNQDVDFSFFYRNFWLSKYERVQKKKLFDSFKKKLGNKTDAEYIDFLTELKEEAKRYIIIVNPQKTDFQNKQEYFPLVQGLKNLSVLGNKQYIIVIMSLLSLKEKNRISLSEFMKSIDFLESFIFMFSTLKHGQANIYENIFSSLAIRLRKSKNKMETNRILKEDLYNNTRLKKNISTVEEFSKEFILLEFTKRRSKNNNIARYVLKKLSDSMDKKTHSDFSVEHILNESNNHGNVLNIGNLIGLEKKLNDEAKDLNFLEKVPVYKKSNYKQVEKFIQTYKNFNDSSIDSRASKLAKYYYTNIIKKGLLI